ncbi:MAG: peptidylprolyl isomerase, partial [bacterium]
KRGKELLVSEQEIDLYCKNHEEDFSDPREAVVSHILLDTEAEAQHVLDRLRQGESFDRLVSALSLDSVTRDMHGKLPPLVKGDMLPEFEDIVFNLKINEISGVIKSDFGYHILKKQSERKLPLLSKEEVRRNIHKKLEKEKFIALLEQLKQEFSVTINQNYFKRGNVNEID